MHSAGAMTERRVWGGTAAEVAAVAAGTEDRCEKDRCEKHWIPACAGMTGGACCWFRAVEKSLRRT